MSRPRFHWVGPLPPARTDIAHYTARILPALAARAEVVLWTDAEDWDPALEAHATVRRYDPHTDFPMPLDGLPPVDGPEIPVFQIGNSWLFHTGPLLLARRVPGIVMLHDIAIQDLLRGMIEHGHLSPGLYRAEMARRHGEAGARAAEEVLADRLRPHEAAVRFPLFEIALPKAVAALSHTPAGEAAIARSGLVPAYGLDLPFAPGAERPAARAADGPLRLVQFGYLAPNRRLDQVLEALASLRDRVDFRLEVFGTLWDEAHVRGKIAELRLADRVELRGFAAEAELDAALAAAHLVFNLRYPTMGEASGSQLRIWAASAAAAVSDTGWYRDLPAESVLRIPIEGEVAALSALVAEIDADRARGAAVGAAGRARLIARHTPERYAEGLLEAAARYERDARDALLAARAGRLLGDTARTRLATDRLARLLETG
ncbi:glycosyltransferase family 4 protein [Paralimibaculum aggregatum]|uniref:Glycosyltransferase family 4 protein n=1 Tax=Paralimibaculum aggregatum TaxID=3036245 RepID=A0ABQ6LM26_9RHOB|nr:glycosyltransferase family 1 protein [Limibaculum sp. NKW23]GMG81878.1 glycosyltransferase family 4 protein [Limibaculum sp. NKW23]